MHQKHSIKYTKQKLTELKKKEIEKFAIIITVFNRALSVNKRTSRQEMVKIEI